MSTVPDYVIENLLAAMVEGRRLKELSDRDLIREHRMLSEDYDDEIYIQEFYSRLWPEWHEEEL